MFGRVKNKRDFSKDVHGVIVNDQYEIQMNDCYNCKELLKEMGYKWNSIVHAWCLTCKVEEIGNAIAEVVIKTNLPLGEYRQMVLHMTDIDIDMSKVSMDEEHTQMISAHYTAK